jgi:sortase A
LRAEALPTPTRPPAAPYAPGPVTQIATIRIPRIGLVAPVDEGVTLTVLDRGPGHWPGTAMPGALGNVVVGGHRVSHTHPFLDIDQLRAGDQITFDMANGTHATYAVSGLEVVPPTALYIVNQTNARTVTLFACHPKGSASQRLVVHGTLASVERSQRVGA